MVMRRLENFGVIGVLKVTLEVEKDGEAIVDQKEKKRKGILVLWVTLIPCKISLCFEVFTRNNGLVQYIIIYSRVFVK